MGILDPINHPLTLAEINAYSPDFYTTNPNAVDEPVTVTENHATTTHIPDRFHSFLTHAESVNQAMR